jgi:hypothetical protein
MSAKTAVFDEEGARAAIDIYRSQGRLASLIDAKEKMIGIAPSIQGDHFFAGMRAMHKNVVGILDAMIAKETQGDADTENRKHFGVGLEKEVGE